MKTMKICVFSDSHGWADGMIAALEKEKPALFFFLGDGERDLQPVGERFPSLPCYAVRGNCDLRSSLPKSLCCAVGGRRIFLCHGHLHQVKYEPGLETLLSAAGEEGASAALFGHTHLPFCREQAGVLLVNPGSIGRSACPRYAVLYMEDEKIRAEGKTL